MSARFWMVCRSPRHAGSKTEPKQRYGSLDEARMAAQALADQLAVPFVVLQATDTVWPKDHTPSLL